MRLSRAWLFSLWPWVVLALTVVPAVWHVLDFEHEADPEFPKVVRPTFNRRPPSAYRLAEPGDTIDRVGLYVSSGAVVLALAGWVGQRRAGGHGNLWPAAIGLALAAFWYSATPGPTFDGWHGWGWRAIADPTAPPGLRLGLALAVLGLIGLLAGSILTGRWCWAGLRARGCLGLLAAAMILVGLRQVEIPGVEPVGYWPRWAFVWGILAFDLALIRALKPPRGRLGWFALGLGSVTAWIALVAGGVEVTWYHRPLARLRTVAPGRIYISAMPTYRGLEVAHGRHQFRTIINLFPEDSPLRSPLHDDEVRFAREHGLRYVESPGEIDESDAFLDRSLALARDPAAWPILVHCHGCMDRSPAWMGIYRFVVEGRPLLDIMREIEQHRGYRPKASVTLLFNRVLPSRSPGRHAHDPTARLLERCGDGTRDPYYEEVSRAKTREHSDRATERRRE